MKEILSWSSCNIPVIWMNFWINFELEILSFVCRQSKSYSHFSDALFSFVYPAGQFIIHRITNLCKITVCAKVINPISVDGARGLEKYFWKNISLTVKFSFIIKCVSKLWCIKPFQHQYKWPITFLINFHFVYDRS